MLGPALPAHLMNITSFPVVPPSRNPHPLFEEWGMQLKPKSRKHARHPDKAPRINKLRLWPAGQFVKQDIRVSFFYTWWSLLYASANAARSPEKIKTALPFGEWLNAPITDGNSLSNLVFPNLLGSEERSCAGFLFSRLNWVLGTPEQKLFEFVVGKEYLVTEKKK